MATYAIGDLHGNLDALKRLLTTIEFDTTRDHLWFVGDIVNRGPDSLGCLRFIRWLGDRAITVLGNHDLAFLVHARQSGGPAHRSPSLAPILAAPDATELLDWLRHRPLIHHDDSLDWTMVHAGIPAEWHIGEAIRYAAEMEHALRGPRHARLLDNLFGDTPAKWAPGLRGYDRLRYITNALTRQRFVYPDGALDMAHKATLDCAPEPLRPWFAHTPRRSADHRIVFGHWAALAPKCWPEHNVWCIDTGAAWGRQLTALRLDTEPAIVAVPG